MSASPPTPEHPLFLNSPTALAPSLAMPEVAQRLNKYNYQVDRLVSMTLATSEDVKQLRELSATGVGNYSDPQKLQAFICDAFTEHMMLWSDMLTAKDDCNSGPHSSTRTLVREAFGKISDMLEQYAEAGKECYAEECYPGTLHWIRLLDPGPDP